MGHVRHLLGGRKFDLEVRLSEDEKSVLASAAGREEMALATWARDVLLTAAETGEEAEGAVRYRRSTPPNPVLLRELAAARSSLAAVANNLNQIAKATNAGQPIESKQANGVYQYVIARVNEIDDVVGRLVGRHS